MSDKLCRDNIRTLVNIRDLNEKNGEGEMHYLYKYVLTLIYKLIVINFNIWKTRHSLSHNITFRQRANIDNKMS